MGWRAWVWFGRAVTPRHFAWQAWHNVTSTFVSRGRRGTNSHLPSFRVAGVALMAWGGALGCGLGARWRRAILRGRRGTITSTFVSRGRRGTNSHLPSFRVAGVALMAWGGALGCGLGARWRRAILLGRRGTTLHPLAFHVAGVAQTRIYLRFAWQAWHSWHGVARLGVVWARGDAAPFCVAGVAERYIHLRFTWQAWHKFASTFVSRGRRGTHGMGWRAWVWFGRAVTPRHFAWQAWHNLTSTFVSRGRCGTNWHPPCFRVAGVAQTRIYLRLAWQAWHKLASTFVSRGRRGTHGMGWRAWVWFGRAVTPRHFAWQAWHNLTSTCVSRGRRGTNSHLPSFRVAGVALMAWVGALGCGLGARWRRAILRGRRRTTWHPPSFHVAGVAQTRIYLRFAWQAWQSSHGVARLGVVWARGDAAPFCVAGVAQRYIHLRFTWQAWHKFASTFVSRGRRGTHGMGWRAWVWFGRAVTPRHFAWQAWHNLTSTFVSRGRCGTNWHPPCFRVAGVALMAWGGAFGCGLGARWRRAILRGRRGRTLHPPSFHVAGVAQTDIHLAFAWQAWQSWHGVARLGAVWARGDAAPFSRGRRGTTSHPPSFHVAGVALMALGGVLGLAWAPVTPRHFAWQAWHKLTPTVVSVAGVAQTHTYCRFTWQAWHKLTSTVVLCGRRGTNSHPPSFCVAGVALGDIHLDYMQGLFAWQAPHSWHLVTYTLISRGTRRGTISRPWRQQLIMTIYQVSLPATGHAERVRKICGFARKSAEHYFGQRKYGEHTIALIAEPGGTRRKRSNLLTSNLLTNNLPYIPTYMTYIHTYLQTYIHTFIPTILPSRSFTTSVVFPSFPVPAKTIEAHFRKKLTCGVIRSFNFWFCIPGSFSSSSRLLTHTTII